MEGVLPQKARLVSKVEYLVLKWNANSLFHRTLRQRPRAFGPALLMIPCSLFSHVTQA
jgi:hypothetical protein